MDKIPEPHPEWAKDRPTESDPQYALPITDADRGQHNLRVMHCQSVLFKVPCSRNPLLPVFNQRPVLRQTKLPSIKPLLCQLKIRLLRILLLQRNREQRGTKNQTLPMHYLLPKAAQKKTKLKKGKPANDQKGSMKNTSQPASSCDRRSFLKFASATGIMAAAGFSISPRKAMGDAYEPYFTDDQLETVVTSCAHNCGSRHMLVAHKKGDVIVRLSTDDGTYQGRRVWNGHARETPTARLLTRPFLPFPALFARATVVSDDPCGTTWRRKISQGFLG